MSASESDRQNILKQMKVRTTYKKDKSWIQQNSEDERDEIPSPISPQLKSLEGRKFLWSPTPETKTERKSGTFTAKEIIATSPSPPVHSSNRQFSYSSNETIRPTSTASQQSPPPSTTGGRTTPSYIIRGQPFNAVSQVKSPTSFNGFQKSYSTVQPRTSASLPRVPNATGHRMSTEEYKKLAPYNIRNRSVDLSDDEMPQTQQEQATRTEQASGVLKNTSSRERSYVLSAAKRNSGTGTQETPSPFVAKRVQIQEEATSPTKKSQTLPKTLSSYLYDDHKRSENHWKDTQSKQGTSEITPSGPGTERSSSPKLTSYSTSNTVETRSSTIKPEPAKITVVRQNSNNSEKTESKPLVERDYSTNTATTRKERVETTKKNDTLPESLASYLYDDVHRFEKSWKTSQPAQSSSQTVTTTRVTDRPESPKLTSWSTNSQSRTSAVKPEPAKVTVLRGESENSESKPAVGRDYSTNTVTTRKERVETTKKNDALPESLASYLYDDVHRFEKSWKSNQPSQSSSQTVTTTRVTDRPESPKLTSWSTNSQSRTSAVKPEPAKVTIIHGESDASDPNIPVLTSSTTRSSNIQPGPGKITVLREEKESPRPSVESRSTTRTTEIRNDVPDSFKLTSSSLSTSVTDNTQPRTQAGPGRITVVRDNGDVDNSRVSSRTTEITTSTTRAKITIETLSDSTPPEPKPRVETKPREAAAANTSDNRHDLISWSDLDTNTTTRVAKERSVSPTPLPRLTNKDSEKTSEGPPLIIISPELNSNRTNQPSKPGVITTLDETKVKETRYRVSESLDEPESYTSNTPGIRRVTVTSTETQSERPRTPEQRSSSPRPTPRPRETTSTTVTESRYRVPEDLDDTMLEAGPSRSNSRTTVTTTRSTDPVYTEYMEESDNRTTRTVSSSRQNITTTTTVETRYGNSSSSEADQYDPQSPSNKGVLFVKEYVNSRESLKSPTSSGSFSNFSDDLDRMSYTSSSSYLYSSPPQRSDEGPCTYCGKEIKDCPKIILEHLNIYCHEYCFKCGICNKPMGDLIDSLFIHRDVVHCESCYEKLFW
ncbi:zinc finger protein 185 [Leptodactylus fuscus]|uniref:zinc finger protein 185 n=1 Tax=Leptodactylus fuscus TaxID=238119 RepID=UPI003F4E9085